jgi:hypothetical protein
MAVSIGSPVARGGWLLALVLVFVASGCSSTSTSCPTGQTSCGGVCVDLASNPLYCGACNVSCNAGASCTGGSCACPADRPATCGLQCVNKQTDPANCGTCGHACGLGRCAAGACVCDTTPTTVALCPNDPATGTCVDTASSGANCGTCGNVCVPARTCSTGTCQCLAPNTACQAGTPAEVCTNLQTDRANCGSCGQACASGYTCAAGACQLVCATGLTNCNGVCVDTRIDPANCGVCGNTCGSGKSCVAGVCQAACTGLTCGGTCCEAPVAGNSCCGTSCPYQHRNFVGTPFEQTYYNCDPPRVWNLGTAQTAARAWAPGGNQITPTQSCPLMGGGSLCLVWQKPILSTETGCAVFCYSGPFEGAATVTTTSSCPCPTQQQIDWY